MLEIVRREFDLPALAALAIREGRIIAQGAVGERKLGSGKAVTIHDKFHLGSITKPMTATLAARLVEQGKLRWHTTLGEAIPDATNRLHREFLSVTLAQLLSHRGGLPTKPPDAVWRRAWQRTGPLPTQRLEFIREIMAQPPASPPGSNYTYSNAGFVAAGVMLERRTGKAWEDLIRELLFEPLGMKSAGFGAPASLGQVDQPWGHTPGKLGPKAVAPGPHADNPASLGPAGTVHGTLADLAKFVLLHLDGARGPARLLKAETFAKLQTPAEGQDYALGWVVVPRSWAGGSALTHNGSNGMFFAVVWLAPQKDFAVVVATNLGGSKAEAGCDRVAAKLIETYLKQ
jgi:CubicO group peptidase (beta-lactamase class C family)